MKHPRNHIARGLQTAMAATALLAACADGDEGFPVERAGREVEMPELDVRQAPLGLGNCSWSAGAARVTWQVPADATAVVRHVPATKAIEVNGETCVPTGSVVKGLSLRVGAGATVTFDHGFGGTLFLLGTGSRTSEVPGVSLEALGSYALSIRGTARNDTVTAGALGVSLNGDNFREIAWTTAPATLRVSAEGGNDSVTGLGGRGTGGALASPMRVFGGDGNDALCGGLGADALTGEAGNDVFTTAATADGADLYLGGDGADSMSYAGTSVAGMRVHDPRWHESLSDPVSSCLGKTPVQPATGGVPCDAAKADPRGYFGVLVVTGAWQDLDTEVWSPVTTPLAGAGTEPERCTSEAILSFNTRLKRDVPTRLWSLSSEVAQAPGKLTLRSGRITGITDAACAERFARGGAAAGSNPGDAAARWCLESLETEGDLFDGVETVSGTAGQDVMLGGDCEGVTLNGLGGDDVLYPGAGGEGGRVDGGDGDDLLLFGIDVAKMAGPNGATSFRGGRGTDMLMCLGCEQGLVVTLDEKANDGFRTDDGLPPAYNERVPCRAGSIKGADSDDVRNDVEVVEGSFGDDVLVGREGTLALGGGLYGSDMVLGGTGRDLLYAGTVGTPGTLPLAPTATTFPRITRPWAVRHGHFRTSVAKAPTPLAYPFETSRTDADREGVAILCGGRGTDTLNGSTGEDYLYGSQDDDVLLGHEGDDVLHGGPGEDWLEGGAGDDVVTGHYGSDLVFCGDGGSDRTLLARQDVICVHTADPTTSYIGEGWWSRPVKPTLCNRVPRGTAPDKTSRLANFPDVHGCEGPPPSGADFFGPPVASAPPATTCNPACQNGGACEADNSCTCPEGWTGAQCQTAICEPACGNNEVCSAPDLCVCAPGWMGEACDVAYTCANPCQNGGTCTGPNTCTCTSGYTGALCQTPPAGGGGGGTVSSGYAFVFDAPTANLDVASPGFGLNQADYTLEFWLRLPTTPSDGLIFTTNNTEDRRLYVSTGQSDGAARAYAFMSQASNYCVEGLAANDFAVPRDGNWHHFAAVRNGAVMEGFLNGTKVATRSISWYGCSCGASLTPCLTAGTAHIGGGMAPVGVAIGPMRFSTGRRYTVDFTPAGTWSTDASTIALWNVASPYANGQLLDAAGGDNNATSGTGISQTAFDGGSGTATAVTVTYDAAGGTCLPNTKPVTSGGTYGTLCAPTRTGYTFAGWTLDGAPVNPSSTVATASDHTLTASWTVNTYTVTYDATPGTCAPGTASVTFGSTYGAAPCTATRAGFSFSGWWTGPGGGGSQVSHDSIVSTPANHSLYATWNVAASCITGATFTQQSWAGQRESMWSHILDADGDGRNDIIWVNQLSNNVEIWWSDVSGFRASVQSVTIGRSEGYVDVGDVTGDGHRDIVASNQDFSRLVLVRGTGPRTFGTSTNISQSGFPGWVRLIDADRDGDLDVVVALNHGSCTSVRLNDGAGNFSAGSCLIAAARYLRPYRHDKDAYPELLDPTNGAVYSTAGGLHLETTLTLPGITVFAGMYPVDVDGDGDDDLVATVTGTDTRLRTYLNHNGSFVLCGETGPISRLPSGSVGDVNGDGRWDYTSQTTCSFCTSTYYVSLQ